ncbi:MAG TPA: hypothetical protein VIQ05_01670 [Tardiphaga sp.]
MRPTRNRSWSCLTRAKTRPGEPSRLAHWPPPFRLGAEKPTIARYVADLEKDEDYKRPAGFRITRGILTRNDD